MVEMMSEIRWKNTQRDRLRGDKNGTGYLRWRCTILLFSGVEKDCNQGVLFRVTVFQKVSEI